MRTNRLVLFSLLIIVLSSCIVVVNGQQDDGDEITTMPSQYVEPGSGVDITKIFLDIKWKEAGDGIYFHMDFNISVSGVMIINSTTKYSLQIGGGAITQDLAVNDILVLNVDEFDYQFTLPYDDTFAFFVFHSAPTWGWMEGWYAKDAHTPEPDFTGLTDGQNLELGTRIDLQIHYEPDRFNITGTEIRVDGYTVKTQDYNTNGTVDWNATLVTSSLGYYDHTVSLIVRDGAGNEGIFDIAFYIPKPYTPPPPPDPAFVYAILGFFVIIGALIGIVSYRNTYMTDQTPPKKDKRKYKTHSEDGKKYKKKHRDRKGYKKPS